MFPEFHAEVGRHVTLGPVEIGAIQTVSRFNEKHLFLVSAGEKTSKDLKLPSEKYAYHRPGITQRLWWPLW